MRKLGLFVAAVLGLYLIARAVIEFVVIDVGDPSTYRNDWGGPTLAGVLAVHVGPGLVAAVLMAAAAMHRIRSNARRAG